MATTLSDIIGQNLQKKRTAGTTDETAAAERLLGAKAGKAAAIGPGTGPARSAMGERAAVSQTQGKLDELRERGAMRAEQLRGTEMEMAQKEAQQVAASEQARQEFKDQAKREELAIFDELEASKKDLGSKQNIAKMEQLGFVLGLQDEQYVFDLQQQGQKQRLDDDLAFKEALQKSIYEDMHKLAQDDIKFKEMMNADGRDFDMKLAKMGMDDALKLAAMESDAANQQALFSALGTLGGIGAGFAGQKLAGGTNKEALETAKEST